jgi:hypothetical protein
MADTTLTSKSVRITEEEAKWLSAAATKGAVTQNDLIRLAVHRLRKELGAAGRIKPKTVVATAKASKYKLTPPRTTAGGGALGRHGAFTCVRGSKSDGRAAPHARSHELKRVSRSRGIDGASPCTRAREKVGGQSAGGWTATSATCSPSAPPRPQWAPVCTDASEAC